MENKRSSRNCVLGSINMDLVVMCQKLPVAGQTIHGEIRQRVLWSKGGPTKRRGVVAGGEVADDWCGAAMPLQIVLIDKILKNRMVVVAESVSRM